MTTQEALRLLQSIGGETKDPKSLGIDDATLNQLIQTGVIEPIGYRLKPQIPTTFPYSLITEPLPLFLHGWFNPSCQEELKRLITQNNVKTIIELGSWLEQSTLFMASLLPEDGKIYAIDHWKGPEDFENPCVYKQFLSNVIHARLTHKIIPMRTTTVEASKNCDIQGDLIYVDACHEEDEVYQDLKHWLPIAKKNRALLCGDDFFWNKEADYPVQKALKHFCMEESLSYKNSDVFWEITY